MTQFLLARGATAARTFSSDKAAVGDEETLPQLLMLTLRAWTARNRAVRHAANAQVEENPTRFGVGGF